MHYGTEASAPVFHELAQQILEYLGVPHDEPIKSTQEMAAIEKHPTSGDAPEEHLDDLNSLFDEVNNLPPDDPLRTPPSKAPTAVATADADEALAYLQTVSDNPSMTVPSPGKDESSDGNVSAATSTLPGQKPAPQIKTAPAPDSPSLDAGNSAPVTVASAAPVTMPGFVGKPMRDVVVTAANLGLNLRVYGSGVASAQAPAAGVARACRHHHCGAFPAIIPAAQ